MLLEQAGEIPVGHELGLEFKIPGVPAELSLRAKVVRQGESDRIAVIFVTTTTRELEALQTYILTQMQARDTEHRHEEEFSKEAPPSQDPPE